MKKFLVMGLALLFLCGQATALMASNLTMEMALEKDGAAQIVERYKIVFESQDEISEFTKNTEEDGSNLLAWRVDYPWFFPHFGSEQNIARTYVLFDEINNSLTLNYFIEGEFATKALDAARETKWEIGDAQFSQFLRQGLIIIPENLTIRITVPKEAVVDESRLTSQASLSGSTIVLSGVSTNNLGVFYAIPKPIASVNLFGGFLKFVNDNMFLVLASIILVVVIAGWKRRGIERRIEDYILAHSEIESVEPSEQEELEIEL